MATVKKKDRNFWHKEATGVLRGILALRHVSNRQLAQALAALGEIHSPKAVSNRISRGTFTFIFFLQCMYALDRTDVRFVMSGLSSEERAAMKRLGEARERNKVRKPRQRHVKAPIKANRPR